MNYVIENDKRIGYYTDILTMLNTMFYNIFFHLIFC